MFGTDLRLLNGTCSDVPIKPHYCLCVDMFQEIPIEAPVSKQVVGAVIDFMNAENELYAKSMCTPLSIERVFRVAKAKGVRNIVHFQAKFSVLPSRGLFEITVPCDVVAGAVSSCAAPEISRVNRYGDQPACISKTAPRLSKFCYCRDYKGDPSSV